MSDRQYLVSVTSRECEAKFALAYLPTNDPGWDEYWPILQGFWPCEDTDVSIRLYLSIAMAALRLKTREGDVVNDLVLCRDKIRTDLPYSQACELARQAAGLALKHRRIIRDAWGRAWVVDEVPEYNRFVTETEVEDPEDPLLFRPPWVGECVTLNPIGFTRSYAQVRCASDIEELILHAGEGGSTRPYPPGDPDQPFDWVLSTPAVDTTTSAYRAVTRATPLGSAYVIATKRTASPAARRYAVQMRAERTKIVDLMVPALQHFFAGQAQRVKHRLYAAAPKGANKRRATLKDVPDDLMPVEEDAALSDVMLPFEEQATRVAVVIGRGELGIDPPADFSELVQAALDQAGERIVGIDDVTRQAIAEALQQANEAGYSLYEIVNGVEADGFPGLVSLVEETYAGRADAIARTEMAYATQDAVQADWQSIGVEEVELEDGEDFDEECADRNGTIQSVDDDADPLHPNCTIVSLPVIPDGGLP